MDAATAAIAPEELPERFQSKRGFDAEHEFFRGLDGRRRKAAAVLGVIWGGTATLHFAAWGSIAVWIVTAVATLNLLRLFWVRAAGEGARPNDGDEAEFDWPSISILVAAKDEEAVIASLVARLSALDYPRDRYELWIVDDNSRDRTPQILARLQRQHDRLRVLRRGDDATGGKSGALNQVVPLAAGEILAVFDADAQVPPDVLRQVAPAFRRDRVGAVQLRKAIAQAATPRGRRNFWLAGQRSEMALDSFFQRQRVLAGGIGELRGNGQFVRRSALQRCGGFNEETITDDLDLTLRLHLDRWDVEFLTFPAVNEEGVTALLPLWHQRNRWAEGGYQRYLDYWRPVAGNRMGAAKTLDMAVFWLMQYFLPQASVPDTLLAIARQQPPVYTPLFGTLFLLSGAGMFLGLRRIAERERPASTWGDRLRGWWEAFGRTVLGTIYMMHWLPVVATMGVRVSLRQKRLKWVKTVHQGTGDALAFADLSDLPD